jgi:magnesium-transporting ATPase (P-type)
MSDTSKSHAEVDLEDSLAKHEEAPTHILLVPYPKVVFLYPLMLVSLAAAIAMQFVRQPLGPDNRVAATIGIVFMGVLAINLVILAFDFPRATSLTLFFFVAAVVLVFLLLNIHYPDMLPALKNVLGKFRPLANQTFYWTFAGVLGLIFAMVMVVVRFDYWEVRPNELLHHHGLLSNLERVYAPHLRIDKEINDIFEYCLLRSGRLILQPSDERRAIVLDNVPMIEKKEAAITRMLGALQVQVRSPNEG